MANPRLLTLLLVLNLSVVLCSRMQSGDETLARVNEDRITAREFSAVVPAATGDTAADRARRRALLDQMINQKLVVGHALALGFGETLASALEKKRDELLRAELEKYARRLEPSRSDIAQESIRLTTEARVRLIEVATYDTAKMVAMLLGQGVPFESLAVRYNRASFTKPDGDLGFAPIARYPQELQPAVQNLAPGQHSEMIVRSGMFYDFVQLVERRAVPAESVPNFEAQVRHRARERRARDFLQGIRNQVVFDEEALAYLVDHADSLRPGDSARVVARRRDGYKVRMGSLVPVLRSYGAVFSSARRRALREDIEHDVLEQYARRIGLDRKPGFKAEYRKTREAGIYQYFYNRYITSRSGPSDSAVAACFAADPARFEGQSLEQAAPLLRRELAAQNRTRSYEQLLSELRARARITIDEKLLAAVKPETQGSH